MSCPVAHEGSTSTPDEKSTAQKPASGPINGELEEIPQPPTKYLRGNLADIDPSFLIKSYWHLAEIWGPIFKLDILGNTSIVISNYDLINEVSDQDRFSKFVPKPQIELRSFMGNGLFTADSDDPTWWKAHRLLVPAFGPLSIRKMFPKMMDIASQMLLKWDRLGPNNEIICSDDFTRLAFDTIGITACGARFNSFYSEEPVPFATWMSEALLEGGRRASRFPVENTLRVWSNARYHDNIAKMHKLCDDIVADRRANPQPDAGDVLNIMLNERESESHEKLSDIDIRHEMVTFLVAGHETTSGTLSFLFYNLLNNPETYFKAQKEADEVIGDGPIEPNHLSQLKYIEACIRETLRYLGPINSYSMHAHEPTVIGGKYHVKPDDFIWVNLRGLHHDPKAWGDDADQFRPERMLDGGWEKMKENAWHPFGTGIRACIGRALAEQEMLINVALILRNFIVTKADPSYNLRLKSTLTVKPENFRIKVRRREGIKSLIGLSGAPSAPPAALGTTAKGNEASAPKRNVAEGKKPLTIGWGSNSGTCKAFAEELQSNAADFGFDAEMHTLDELAERVPTDHPVLIITPSYEGKPPDNGRKFVSWLEAHANAKLLEGGSYCVFGAGNSEWTATFHRIPKLVDALLGQMGAKRILSLEAVDVRSDPVGPFEEWAEKMWKALRSSTGASASVETKSLNVKVQKSDTPETLAGGNAPLATVQKNFVISSTEVGPAKRHMELLLPPDSNYRSGDYLVVLPYNPVVTVKRILNRFSLRADDLITVTDTNKSYLASKHPESAFDFFMSRVELGNPSTKRQCATLAAATPEGDERQSLERLQDDAVYEKEVLAKRASVIDLLEDYPSCKLELGAYIDMLKPLTPRQYSISSSPRTSTGLADPGSPQPLVASITYDVLKAPARSGHNRLYHGTASNHLAQCEPGHTIRAWVRPTNANFHLPPDPTTPIIMVCAGTGLAPMRGFIQTRAALHEAGGRPLGPALLYFGCRDFEKDYIYKDELEKYHADGVVDVRPAFSQRGPPDAKASYKHAPDRIWAERDEIAALFVKGARIFVCGSASKLAKSTGDVVRSIWLEKNPGRSEQDAAQWLQTIKEDRYVSDVFG